MYCSVDGKVVRIAERFYGSGSFAFEALIKETLVPIASSDVDCYLR
jgi:hypothetical protein